MNGQTDKTRGSFKATVIDNRRIGKRFYKMVLQFENEAAAVFARTKPGQFAQIDLTRTAMPEPENVPEHLSDAAQRFIILRRPYSFCDVNTKDNKTFAEILYCAVGAASVRMAGIQQASSIELIGPLGNGFWIPTDKRMALLVVGGMGAPPIRHLAKIIGTEHPEIQAIAFVGARTKTELPFEGRIDDVSQQIGYPLQAFAKYGIESQIATDDGSVGSAGPVTELLEGWLNENRYETEDVIIYACGPEPMLAEVARIAKARRIDCQISMERIMACGIGLCQSCAVKCRMDDTRSIYKLCCKDGPVFDAAEVIFEKNDG